MVANKGGYYLPLFFAQEWIHGLSEGARNAMQPEKINASLSFVPFGFNSNFNAGTTSRANFANVMAELTATVSLWFK